MKKNRISSAVIRRLPRYYRHLTDLAQHGVERISSYALGESMGLTASQIRQDLSCFGGFGQQGYGYNVANLRSEISSILGMDNGYAAVILGVGNLGRALIENFQFSLNGFDLVAAFDINPHVVGTEIAGVPILHADQLSDFAAQHPIHVGVLTVPQSVAAESAKHLVELGVRGIWNLTNTELPISDPSVTVEDVHFADSLLALSYMISEE